MASINLNNIYLGNNQNIQYIKHSKYRQDSETSNYCFYKSVSLLARLYVRIGMWKSLACLKRGDLGS